MSYTPVPHSSCTSGSHEPHTQVFLTTHPCLALWGLQRALRQRLCSRVMSEQGKGPLHTYIDRRKAVIRAVSSTEEGGGVLSHTGQTWQITLIE